MDGRELPLGLLRSIGLFGLLSISVEPFYRIFRFSAISMLSVSTWKLASASVTKKPPFSESLTVMLELRHSNGPEIAIGPWQDN